jgi:hypothetical protein
VRGSPGGTDSPTLSRPVSGPRTRRCRRPGSLPSMRKRRPNPLTEFATHVIPHGQADQLGGTGGVAALLVQAAEVVQGRGVVGVALGRGVAGAGGVGAAAGLVGLPRPCEVRVHVRSWTGAPGWRDAVTGPVSSRPSPQARGCSGLRRPRGEAREEAARPRHLLPCKGLAYFRDPEQSNRVRRESKGKHGKVSHVGKCWWVDRLRHRDS